MGIDVLATVCEFMRFVGAFINLVTVGIGNSFH